MVSRVLCVPYTADDLVSALALKEMFNAPLCTYLMDDNNIGSQGISDELMREALEKSKNCGWRSRPIREKRCRGEVRLPNLSCCRRWSMARSANNAGIFTPTNFSKRAPGASRKCLEPEMAGTPAAHDQGKRDSAALVREHERELAEIHNPRNSPPTGFRILDSLPNRN